MVPKIEEIADRWRAILHSGVSPDHARRVILTQALILLWGVRVSEGLTALVDDMEGHLVLVSGKTGLRISYLNSQALGLVKALSGHGRLTGWRWTPARWHRLVQQCGIDDGAKPQQDLRKRFATWVSSRDADVEKLLAGHGGGVVFDHYLSTLEKVPAVMEDFALPDVPGWKWPDPVYLHRPLGTSQWGPREEAAAAAVLTPPRTLYARFEAWLEEQERLAAE